MRVKRWMLLTLFGLFLFLSGVALVINMAGYDFVQWLNNGINYLFNLTGWYIGQSYIYVTIGLIVAVIGILLIFVSYFEFNRSVLAAVAPDARPVQVKRRMELRSSRRN